jgi:hypothetical protein
MTLKSSFAADGGIVMISALTRATLSLARLWMRTQNFFFATFLKLLTRRILRYV